MEELPRKKRWVVEGCGFFCSGEIQRAWAACARPFHYMQVDHRGFDAGMPHEALNGADIGTGFEQMRCERMAHRRVLRHTDFAHVASRTLIEIEGGIFIPGGGRHSRGAGYAKDAEKYLEAVLAGWTVISVSEVVLMDW